MVTAGKKQSTGVVSSFSSNRAAWTPMTLWMGFHSPITDDYSDVWDECHCCCCPHNPLHPSSQPSTQQIQVLTWELSINGVTPCHQILKRNRLWNKIRIIGNVWGNVLWTCNFFLKSQNPPPLPMRPGLPLAYPREKKLGLLGAY